MNAAKIKKEIQWLKTTLQDSQKLEFIILHGEEDKARYADFQLEKARIIEIRAVSERDDTEDIDDVL